MNSHSLDAPQRFRNSESNVDAQIPVISAAAENTHLGMGGSQRDSDLRLVLWHGSRAVGMTTPIKAS